MKILAFIPARSGSKRIPNKNIALLGGKPLIAYTIEAAKKAKLVNRIVVSTDSQEIADVAKKYGAEVPFLRPAEISQSDSMEMEFFTHALDWFKNNENYEPDLIVMLFSTSPFRKPQSINKAIEEIIKHPEADSLRSVKICSEHPYKMWIMDKNGYLKPFVTTEDFNMHTLAYHLLPKVYIQNASIYITKPSTIRSKKSPIGDIVIAFIMSEDESVDINNPIDLKLAEELIKNKND